MRRYWILGCIIAFISQASGYAQCNFTVSVNVTNLTCHQSNDGIAAAIVSGGVGPFTYVWNTTPTQNGDQVSGLIAGFYTVSVSDSAGCVVNRPFSVTQPQRLTADIGFDTALCAGNSTQLRSLVFGGTLPYTYEWWCSASNCGLSGSGGATPTILPESSTKVYFKATDANGCESQLDSVTVIVNPLPVVDAGEDQMTFINEPVTLMPNVSSTGKFEWTPEAGLSDPTTESPEATVAVTTEFTLTFTDPNGCISSDVVSVIVDPDITIPTGLTPNGDQINDVWDVKNLSMYPNCRVEIFNRTGNRVFNSTGYNSPWDGGDSPAGTYFYIIDLGESGTEILKGSLTLIR